MDDDVDHELIAFMRKALGWDPAPEPALSADTGVKASAQFIFDNALDVALNMQHCKDAAEYIWKNMKDRGYSTKSWAHELHPSSRDAEQVNFVFTMDLLSFCFWSESDRDGVYTVEYPAGRKWTGYFSMVAALKRAVNEGIPITSPYFVVDSSICTDDLIRHIFRSSTKQPMPMLEERIKCLREASSILCERYDGSFTNLIAEAEGSAGKLVNLLVKEFSCFRDETAFEGRTVKFYKRAQILVADIWASFDGESYGKFDDINSLTMFAGMLQKSILEEPCHLDNISEITNKETFFEADNNVPDYRIPQILQSFGCISYSPILELRIRDKRLIESRHKWEVELRGCSIHCVELIRREIIKNHPEAETNLNAVLMDFFLYDLVKEHELSGQQIMPHHRTRSIWY